MSIDTNTIHLDEEIQREQACIEDLIAEIEIHVQKGQINKAIQRDLDLHNSLKHLEKLHSRKRLWLAAAGLNIQGKKAKVVKKVAYQA
ncbi:hypothetical protein [Lysinibacillus xylanilyticus]|uniref:hypothetical protein n=1 Tax=Lysinibacillus xylanilyticus TaxID=582475 RepID=UPI00380516B9